MTIANLQSVISNSGLLDVYFTGRDLVLSSVDVTKQETRVAYKGLPFTLVSSGRVEIDITPIIKDGLTIESTLTLVMRDSLNKSIYRDIIVFEGRVNSTNDYEQTEGGDNGYIFA